VKDKRRVNVILYDVYMSEFGIIIVLYCTIYIIPICAIIIYIRVQQIALARTINIIGYLSILIKILYIYI
jgi:hypothetical protein